VPGNFPLPIGVPVEDEELLISLRSHRTGVHIPAHGEHSFQGIVNADSSGP